MIMTIKIEKNIPMPTRAAGKPRAEKYPELRQLEVGDSFMVPIGASALANHARRVAKDTGHKFLVRTVVDKAGAELGARVWRKA
jgi:hypothetical protein